MWAAKRAKAADKPLTSVCPAWLRLDATGRFVAIPERAAVVQRIYREAAAGRGQHAIVLGLNRDGVPTFGHRGRRGKQWHRSYVVKILANPAVAGTVTPHRIEHQAGSKRRIPMDQVPGYYPPVVDDDAYQRVQALNGTRQPLRGRHASGTVANVLGGLARCPLCDGSMTLITKGGRWRYLICQTARTGAGCRYRAVRYQDVERAVVEGVDAILRKCPSGNPEEERLSGLIDDLDEQISVMGDELANLLETAAHRSSPALAQRIADIEAEILQAREEQRGLATRVAVFAPTRRQARLEDIERAAKTQPLDRAALNAALRVLLSGVVVDYPSGHLVFRWHHGDETQLFWAWPEDEGGSADPSC